VPFPHPRNRSSPEAVALKAAILREFGVPVPNGEVADTPAQAAANSDIAITMGNVYLQNATGDKVMVDKTFVFRLCRDGKLRLCVHKSALPYSPDR